MQFTFDLAPGESAPDQALARLHAAGPVVWSENIGGWLVNGAAEVRKALSDLNNFTSAGTPVAEVFNGEGMLVNDTPMHHKIRAVWAARVSRQAMGARRNEFAEAAQAIVASVRPALDAGQSIDFMPLFRQMVLAMIARLFAVPDNRLDTFERWAQLSADTPALGLEPGSPEHQRHEQGKAEVYALIAEQVADRRARTAAGAAPDDLIAAMVAAVGHNGITEQIMLDNLFNFILGAIDTTERWLGNVLEILCLNPHHRSEILSDRTLLEPFIEEVMRHTSVAQVIQRRVRAGGAELGGQSLAEGDTLYVMLGAANRDPGEYPEPGRLDPHRPAKAHFGFGFGFHHCLGLHIARAEVLAFIEAVLDGLPALAVESCDRGSNWALWGPRRLILQVE